MIEKLEIENYRGIARGEISDLAPLTVLVGPNSSGKSSLLEALYLAYGAHTEPLARVALRRGWIGDATLGAWLPSGNATLRITVDRNESRYEIRRTGPYSALMAGSDVSVGIQVSGPSTVSSSGTGRAISPTFIEIEKADVEPQVLDQAVSRADLRGEGPSLIELLKPLLPGIRDLRILQPANQYALHVYDDSPEAWPAIAAGDGIKKLLVLAAKIASDTSGLILVEEPETYLHVGALQQVAKLFWQAVFSKQRPKQIVAATHSLELIDALFGHEGADLSQSAIFRLSLRTGELRTVRIPGNKVRELRRDIGEDLRR